MNQHEANAARILAGTRKRNRRLRIVVAVLLALTVVLSLCMMTYGNTVYSLSHVWNVLQGREQEGSFTILMLRLPRLLSGILAGFAFGIAGSVFQTMLHNPLANPNILGITSASSAGAVFCILILQAGYTAQFTGSILVAVITAGLIYGLSRVRRYTTGRLILIGIGFQAMMNAAINYMMLIGNENDIASAMRWMSGSLNGATMSSLAPLAVCVLFLTPVILASSKRLQILELGDESAISLGSSPAKARAVLMLSTVVLTAVASAVTGPIAFVAFLSGPIGRKLAGYGSCSPIPGGLFGIILVLASDLLGQYAFEIRFPVGVITGLLGAPYLIWLLIRMNKRGEF